jgi:hypothetical protein
MDNNYRIMSLSLQHLPVGTRGVDNLSKHIIKQPCMVPVDLLLHHSILLRRASSTILVQYYHKADSSKDEEYSSFHQQLCCQSGHSGSHFSWRIRTLSLVVEKWLEGFWYMYDW